MIEHSNSSSINTVELKDLVRHAGQLATLPEAYYRLQEVLDEPSARGETITRIIESDTALTARLLRLVNSPLYSGLHRGGVDRISYAVQLSGTHTLRNLVLTTVISSAFLRLSSGRDDLTSFWHHSVYSGLVATQLAKRCNVLHPDRLLVAGLVHDIGNLVMYQGLPNLTDRVLSLVARGENGGLDAERLVYGYTHCEVGAALLELWQLPISLREIAAWHHEPQQADSSALDVSLIHLANAIANRAGTAHHIGWHDSHIDPWSWKLTGLDETVIEPTLDEANERFLETLKIFIPKHNAGTKPD